MDMQVTPTEQAHRELANAFDVLNQKLFGGELPRCLITLQRIRASRGYFSAHRFIRNDAITAHEIAINPQMFALATMQEVLSEIAHNMAHLWAHVHGQQGRRGYHSKGWATQMESIGLMPSTTGSPGGKSTGEKVEHYIVPGGRFEAVADEMIADGFNITWLDRIAAPWRENAEDQSDRKEHLLGGALLMRTGLLVSQQNDDDPELTPVPATANQGGHETIGESAGDGKRHGPETGGTQWASDSDDSDRVRDEHADRGTAARANASVGDAFDPEAEACAIEAGTAPQDQVILDSGVKARAGQESKAVPLIVVGAEDINGTVRKPRADKVKYTCPTCHLNAWAKGGIALDCGTCKEPMIGPASPAAN